MENFTNLTQNQIKKLAKLINVNVSNISKIDTALNIDTGRDVYRVYVKDQESYIIVSEYQVKHL